MDTILEIKCKPVFKEEDYSCSLKSFSWIFADIPASASSFFRLVETEFSSNPFSRLVCMYFGLISNLVLLFGAFFLLLESITEIRRKPVFFDLFSSEQWKQFFRLLETNFLSNAIYFDEWKRMFCLVLFNSEPISS